MVIFHGYVSLPEGIQNHEQRTPLDGPCMNAPQQIKKIDQDPSILSPKQMIYI